MLREVVRRDGRGRIVERGIVRFFDWYNHEHRHGSLGLCTPYEVHHGLAAPTLARRGTILDAAFLAHPGRFSQGRPVPPSLPTEVWINKPEPEVSTEEDAAQQILARVSQIR